MSHESYSNLEQELVTQTWPRRGGGEVSRRVRVWLWCQHAVCHGRNVATVDGQPLKGRREVDVVPKAS